MDVSDKKKTYIEQVEIGEEENPMDVADKKKTYIEQVETEEDGEFLKNR
jgi:hypothetical protein